ncbi:hypothetical protein [Bacillus phage Tomato]|nr:hypothetical protein [Bacillus phage Tomato]
MDLGPLFRYINIEGRDYMYKSIIEVINIYIQRGYQLEYTNGSTFAVFNMNGFYHLSVDILNGEPMYYYSATVYITEENPEGKRMFMCKDFEDMDRQIRPFEDITSLEKDVDKE